MPNWCQNTLTIKHKDANKIDNLMAYIRADEEGELFNYIKPMPYNEWNYEWCLSNWGTKWDAIDMDYYQPDDNTVSFTFDTAWSPPEDIYKELHNQGFEVEAYYVEFGLGFAGEWHTGIIINDIHDGVTEALDEEFNITEYINELENIDA